MNNQERKARILEDIANAKSDGYTLVAEDWGGRTIKCACPLGCVNLGAGGLPEDQFDGGVKSILSVDDNWIQSFIDGFDGNGHADGATLPEAWQMGRDIRTETKAVDFGEFVDHMDENDE